MRRIFPPAIFLVALVCFVIDGWAGEKFASVPWVDQPAGKEPAIVHFGFTSPDTIYLRRNIEEIEKRPFTGIVTWISWPRQENGRMWLKKLPGDPPETEVYDLTRRIITRDPLPQAAMDGALADLKATKFTKLKHNFLATYFIAAPGLKPNFWYDDELWTVACQNFAAVARVAKQGGCKGLFIDTETHDPAPWSYMAMREADPAFYADKSWEDAQAKARQRGREVAVALNSEFPDITLFFMRMYSHSHAYGLYPASDLKFHKYFGLYEAFMDGLLEGSTDETILVDGCDNSIRVGVDRFAGGRYRALEVPLRTGTTQVPDLFKKKMRVGFGTYLGSYNIPWNPENPSANEMTPEMLQDFIRMGLQFGDGYLWFWNEWGSWWLDGPDAKPADGVLIHENIKYVPQAYWEAIENGIRDAKEWKSHPNKKYYQ